MMEMGIIMIIIIVAAEGRRARCKTTPFLTTWHTSNGSWWRVTIGGDQTVGETFALEIRERAKIMNVESTMMNDNSNNNSD